MTEREQCIAYLRSLPPSGGTPPDGVAKLLTEARICEWDPDTLVDHTGADIEPYATIDWVDRGDFGEGEWMAVYGNDRQGCETEIDARGWVESCAIADGWTIAVPGGR